MRVSYKKKEELPSFATAVIDRVHRRPNWKDPRVRPPGNVLYQSPTSTFHSQCVGRKSGLHAACLPLSG